MSDLKGTTRAQTRFLRAFRSNLADPPADQWPSVMVLRRWLKKPGFCGAMNSILRAMRYQADFHLTAAAASGASILHTTVGTDDPVACRKQIESLTQLLRMSHIRNRFAEPLPVPPPRGNLVLEVLRYAHPSLKVADAFRIFDQLLSRDGEKRTELQSIWRRAGHSYPEDHVTPKVPHIPYDTSGQGDDEEDDTSDTQEEK